jgi:hypothetical protein
MTVGAMHGKSRRTDFADLEPGLPRAPQARNVLFAHGRYFFFVSFNTITSSL